jgi:hypothetical protein
MTGPGVDAFVDAQLADRRPKGFSAPPDDADLVRLAIELHASQAETTGPDPRFVRELGRQLAAAYPGDARVLPLHTGAEAGGRERAPLVTGSWPPRGRATRPRFGPIGTAAAALALVAGTFAAAHLVQPPSPAPGAPQGPAAAATERSGTLLTSAGVPVGHAYAYSGDPSWVMMDVVAPGFSGVYRCELQLADGAMVSAGDVVVHHGSGEWARPVKAPGGQLRRAVLVTSSGVTVATATLS